MTDTILTAIDGPVLTVTLNRPDALNAQLPSMWTFLAEIGATLRPEIRVVVIKGAGRAFSAGLDRRMFGAEPIKGEAGIFGMAALEEEDGARVIDEFQDGFAWLHDPKVISIAVVQGHAIGAGFQLALACDLRIVAENTQFAMAETGLGLVPDLGGTAPLVKHVGYSRALELCVTGRRMGAAEAFALGLATVVVPNEQLEQATADVVAAVTAPMHGAVTATKALLQQAVTADLDQQRHAERRAQLGRLRELASVVGAHRSE